MEIFCNFSPTSNHIRPIQVENCDSNSRLVVDKDDNGKFRLERVKELISWPSLKILVRESVKNQDGRQNSVLNQENMYITGIIYEYIDKHRGIGTSKKAV